MIAGRLAFAGIVQQKNVEPCERALWLVIGCSLMPLDNILYLAVLPLVSVDPWNAQRTQQVLTLFGNSNLATEFFPDEVDSYIEAFRAGAQQGLIGGRVSGFSFEKESTTRGLVKVKVIQHVQ